MLCIISINTVNIYVKNNNVKIYVYMNTYMKLFNNFVMQMSSFSLRHYLQPMYILCNLLSRNIQDVAIFPHLDWWYLYMFDFGAEHLHTQTADELWGITEACTQGNQVHQGYILFRDVCWVSSIHSHEADDVRLYAELDSSKYVTRRFGN